MSGAERHGKRAPAMRPSRRRPSGRSAGILLVFALATSCQLVAPFDVEDLRCPCPSGYVCGEGDRCRAPSSREDSDQSCGDGVDNDGDGATDCDDTGCRDVSACQLFENTLETCRDGVDNDGDGAIDCEDQGCVEADVCQPYPEECDPLTSDPCAAGLSCSLTRDEDGEVDTVCRLPGQVHVSGVCQRDGAPTEVCGPRTACVLFGAGVSPVCQRLCRSDADCGESALCAIELREVDLGLCTTACLPWAPAYNCATDYVCVPVLVDPEDSPRSEGGAVTTCVHPEVAQGFGVRGQSEPCDPMSDDPEELCTPSLLCAPATEGSVCIRYCEPGSDLLPSGCGDCPQISILGHPVVGAERTPVGGCQGDAPT